MENCLKKSTVATICFATVITLAYMYLKNNPDIVCDMKHMAKDMAKKTYNKLDELD